MDKPDQNKEYDDGIIAEDITQLIEHIELTGPQRLINSPEWEMAKPAADLDDAPILIDDEDPERYTETEFDLSRRLQDENRDPERATELAAERMRWQQRVETLMLEIEERDQLLAERERQIEDLQARLATSTLERAGIERDLRETRDLAAAVEAEIAAPAARAPEPEPPPQPLRELVPDPDFEDASTSLPMIDSRAAPRARRYLIGIDQVGSVLEVSRDRQNIGRTQDNHLRIVDPTVSRLHAMLTVRGGEVMVIDANSRNGLFVNGIQVRYARLEDGDLVTFGTVRYRYRVGSGAMGDTAGAA